MQVDELLEQAIELVEKANGNLEPELMPASSARRAMRLYARIERLGAFGLMALASKLDDPGALAHITGTSVGKAKQTVETAKVMKAAPELSDAMAHGDISLDQAKEIARTEQARPGSAGDLVKVAQKEPFHVFVDTARRKKLEAEQHGNLGTRQHHARSARSWTDELGMVNVNLRLEPLVGVPLVNRAEAEAARLRKQVRKTGDPEPFERYLADAYAAMLAGRGKGRATRPELVVLVSHEVVTRGWTGVKAGEVCKVPGVGPVPPEQVREIARDAFVNALSFDGIDLRNYKRWGRYRPPEINVALELGEPPDFDGVKCVDCASRWHPESDHFVPVVAHGETSTTNNKWRCSPCHKIKTEKDRRAGKLKPPDP